MLVQAGACGGLVGCTCMALSVVFMSGLGFHRPSSGRRSPVRNGCVRACCGVSLSCGRYLCVHACHERVYQGLLQGQPLVQQMLVRVRVCACACMCTCVRSGVAGAYAHLRRE